MNPRDTLTFCIPLVPRLLPRNALTGWIPPSDQRQAGACKQCILRQEPPNETKTEPQGASRGCRGEKEDIGKTLGHQTSG